MREFLRGWRRKIGVTTLMTACVLTTLWLRSSAHVDALFVNGQKFAIVSALGEIGCFMDADDSDDLGGLPIMIGTNTIERFPHLDRSSGESKFVPFVNQEPIWRMGAIGIQCAANPLKSQIVVAVSYLWIVPSITLLSAYLLLRKPNRAVKPANPAISDSNSASDPSQAVK